jgi:hypothetical protein
MFRAEPPRRRQYGASPASGFVSKCPPHHREPIASDHHSLRMVNCNKLDRLPRQRRQTRGRPTYIQQTYMVSTSSFGSCGHEMLEQGGGVSKKRSGKDMKAASRIEEWFQQEPRRRHERLTGRILRNLINRRTTLDDESLDNLLFAADKVLFNGRLNGRVRWRWSFSYEHQYNHDLLGTTALVAAPLSTGRLDTLIVLSTPLLQNEEYNRDLLLSAFLHELVHCYLFIQCGLDHAKDDGHTEGFKRIAKVIDTWIGHQRLHLCNMRANLDDFRIRDEECCGGQEAVSFDEGYASGVSSPACFDRL